MVLNVVKVIPATRKLSSVVQEEHTHAFPALSSYREMHNIVLNNNF